MKNKWQKNLLQTLDRIQNNNNNIPHSIQLAIEEIKNLKFNNNFIKLERFLRPVQSITKNPNQERRFIQMAENENNAVETFDLQMLRSTNFRHRLGEVYQDQVVAVEFCCGDFLKIAIGCCNLIGCDFIELVGTSQSPVVVEIFCCEGAIEPPAFTTFRIIIPLDKVAGVELLSTPPCPPCPPPCPPKRDRRGYPYSEDEEE